MEENTQGVRRMPGVELTREEKDRFNQMSIAELEKEKDNLEINLNIEPQILNDNIRDASDMARPLSIEQQRCLLKIQYMDGLLKKGLRP